MDVKLTAKPYNNSSLFSKEKPNGQIKKYTWDNLHEVDLRNEFFHKENTWDNLEEE